MKIFRPNCERFVAKTLQGLALAIITTLSLCSGVDAGNDVWDGNGATPPNGVWGTGLNWVDNTAPNGGDQTTFNVGGLGGTYTVTFSADPVAIQALSVTAGNVTFSSGAGSPRTLNVTSPTGGQDVTISGGSLVL